MTECSQFSVGVLGRREVVGRFDGGRVSSDGGLLLLREVDRRYGVTEAIADRLRDRRRPGKVRQSLHDLVRQHVYQIACGYEDCNDAATLAGDPIRNLQANSAFIFPSQVRWAPKLISACCPSPNSGLSSH